MYAHSLNCFLYLIHVCVLTILIDMIISQYFKTGKIKY
jgi:hypothetical protein